MVSQAQHELLMSKWDELNEAVGGDLFVNYDKAAAMRRVSKEESNHNCATIAELVEASINNWDSFQKRVLEEIERVSKMNKEEKSLLPLDKLQIAIEDDRRKAREEKEVLDRRCFNIIMAEGSQNWQKSYDQCHFFKRFFIRVLARMFGWQIDYRNPRTGFTLRESDMLKVIDAGNRYYEDTYDGYPDLTHSENVLRAYRTQTVEKYGRLGASRFSPEEIFVFSEMLNLLPAYR